MQPYRGFGWAFVVALIAAGANPVDAAWCNVFQVCCHSCRTGCPTGSGYGACYGGCATPSPCSNSCPQTCTTRYVQRCYYQPVTCYQTQTRYEPVTTYQTSYYYEPVTSYRYSCNYDPCSCSYQQVACPTTCYQLRSQCCPVQSWVQRCCQVPVTTYRQAYYYEPLASCCQSPCSSCGTSCYQSPCSSCGTSCTQSACSGCGTSYSPSACSSCATPSAPVADPSCTTPTIPAPPRVPVPAIGEIPSSSTQGTSSRGAYLYACPPSGSSPKPSNAWFAARHHHRRCFRCSRCRPQRSHWSGSWPCRVQAFRAPGCSGQQFIAARSPEHIHARGPPRSRVIIHQPEAPEATPIAPGA